MVTTPTVSVHTQIQQAKPGLLQGKRFPCFVFVLRALNRYSPYCGGVLVYSLSSLSFPPPVLVEDAVAPRTTVARNPSPRACAHSLCMTG